MATFSPAFCKHLAELRSAQLTPAKFLANFEKHVSNNANKQFGNVYNFPIPRDISDECIRCLIDNLKSFGFTEGNQAYNLAPQTFVFTKEDYVCQWDTNTVVCKASDKGCDRLRIRM